MSAHCGSAYGYDIHMKAGESACAACLEAHRIDHQGYLARRARRPDGRTTVPAVGAQRRVRALVRMGWSYGEIGKRAGWTRRNAANVMLRQRVHVDTFNVLSRIYDELSMTIGPSPRSRASAIRAGWPGPLDWDDIDNPDEVPYSQRPEARELRALERKRAQDRAAWPQKKARLQAGRQAA